MSSDFDRGFGIGGLGQHTERSTPTAKQIEHIERMERVAQCCSDCGQSDVFDGAMFTTDPSNAVCDDCFG